jgi:NADH dehydrogenase FAD-containing subunit
MPTLPENLLDYVQRVEAMTSSRVMSCDAHGVELEHGRLDADTIIWAAGVVASSAARWLDAEHDRAGRVKVGVDLSVPSHPDIFVVGDTAAVTDQPGIPGTAPGGAEVTVEHGPRSAVCFRQCTHAGSLTCASGPPAAMGRRWGCRCGQDFDIMEMMDCALAR